MPLLPWLYRLYPAIFQIFSQKTLAILSSKNSLVCLIRETFVTHKTHSVSAKAVRNRHVFCMTKYFVPDETPIPSIQGRNIRRILWILCGTAETWSPMDILKSINCFSGNNDCICLPLFHRTFKELILSKAKTSFPMKYSFQDASTTLICVI